ncbi:MAG TPA: methyltransferase domain-containing protein [Vicinamibacterales bacterium]|nr:methyltransferase domain-containing protein [Vicinamibacterales bacterium]
MKLSLRNGELVAMLDTLEASKSSLGHLPRTDRWMFDESVTDVFVDMLRRSVPQYDIMRRSVFDLGAEFVQPGTHIVDLGCSRGDALAAFIDAFGSANAYIGVDVSEPMLERVRDRFAPQIDAGIARFTHTDLRSGYPQCRASLTLCVLTLQFTPIDYRQRILEDIYRSTVPGGALVIVEKVLGATAGLGNLMIRHYHAHKSGNGYSAEEIERKRLALEGVLVPVTAHWNEEMLSSAGFQEIDCFWRWMNFAGWVAVRSR